jgi:uncharacterized protein (DUF1778 family)
MYNRGVSNMDSKSTSISHSTHERVLRDTRINLRGTSAELEFIRRAAAASGKSLTEFVLESAAIAAERVLADRSHFTLEPDAWRAFQEALERPAVLKPRLRVLLNEPESSID